MLRFLLEQLLVEVEADVATGTAAAVATLWTADAVLEVAAELTATADEVVATALEDEEEATLDAAATAVVEDPEALEVSEDEDEETDPVPSEETVTFSAVVPGEGSVRVYTMA